MMSGPELPYLISSSEEALALLRKITKRVDDLCKRFNNLCDNLCKRFENLCLHLDKVHYQNQIMLQNSKLQMQPQAVPVSYFSILIKPTSRNIIISSDLDPDLSASLNSGGLISQGFRVPSNHDPHISRL